MAAACRAAPARGDPSCTPSSAGSIRLLDSPLDLGAAPAAVSLAAVLLVAIYIFPLWNLTMFAPQYPEGLRLDIYSYKLVGGNNGQDIKEINVLNHYIGMRDLVAEDFTEFKWLPFAVGVIGLLYLRAAVLGTLGPAVRRPRAQPVLLGVRALVVRLQASTRTATPSTRRPSVRVEPFMPPMFGFKQLANFEVYSYPALASYAHGRCRRCW